VDSHAEGDADGQATGGDRTLALLGMQSVVVAIGDVVDEIDRARKRTEDHERAAGGPHRRREQPLPEHEAAEDEQVLDPLLRSQRDEDGGQHPAARAG